MANLVQLTPWRAALLAALLLLAQALGHGHAVAHGLPGGPASEVHDEDAHGHEAGSAECRLVDALSHGDLATAAAAPAAAQPPQAAAAPIAAQTPRAATPAWHPPARGPPR